MALNPKLALPRDAHLFFEMKSITCWQCQRPSMRVVKPEFYFAERGQTGYCTLCGAYSHESYGGTTTGMAFMRAIISRYHDQNPKLAEWARRNGIGPDGNKL